MQSFFMRTTDQTMRMSMLILSSPWVHISSCMLTHVVTYVFWQFYHNGLTT